MRNICLLHIHVYILCYTYIVNFTASEMRFYVARIARVACSQSCSSLVQNIYSTSLSYRTFLIRLNLCSPDKIQKSLRKRIERERERDKHGYFAAERKVNRKSATLMRFSAESTINFSAYTRRNISLTAYNHEKTAVSIIIGGPGWWWDAETYTIACTMSAHFVPPSVIILLSERARFIYI